MNLPRAALALLASFPCLALDLPPDAQPDAQPEAQPAGQAPPVPPEALQLGAVAPQLVLGQRVRAIEARVPALPVVVIATDAGSFVQAIAAWTPDARFPVLLDDGHWLTRENIARFVRGYKPTHVARWTAPGEAMRPTDRPERSQAAVASAWGLPDPSQLGLIKAWKEAGMTPPGVILADARDSAWTAALALSAARAQPIAWVTLPRGVNRVLQRDECDKAIDAIKSAVSSTGLSWAGLGDEVDAITICAGVPVRLADKDRETLAVMDVLGRDPATGARWAWTGQIFGGEAGAAYMAMCSTFMPLGPAWVFDAYPPEAPWSDFSGADAARVLTEASGVSVTLDAGAGASLAGWRGRASRPVDAGVILVNTKGAKNFFQIDADRGVPGDVPWLARPAAVHFVHSWSAVQPLDRDTVCGRWLERGAYLYAGSVQEPFLSAFVPTPMLAVRLAGGAPWGAAMRLDPTPPWRITLIGDPLATLTGGPRREGEAKRAIDRLAGAVSVEDQMREALQGGDFASALRALRVLGRDEDAARLARTVMEDQPEAFTPEVAEAACLSFLEVGDKANLVVCYAKLSPEHADDPARRDALWSALLPDLATTTDAGVVALLSMHLREGQLVRDALDLLPAMERVRGPGGAQSFIGSLRDRVTDQRELRELERATTGRRRGR